MVVVVMGKRLEQNTVEALNDNRNALKKESIPCLLLRQMKCVVQSSYKSVDEINS